MIVYAGPGAAVARRGEFHPFPGARSRTRLIPYSGLDAVPDPWRGLYRRPPELTASAGPSDPGAWREALAHAPAGKLLLGPVGPAEAIYGAGEGALAAAAERGRAVVAIETMEDPGWRPVAGPSFARVVVWEPDPEPERFWRAFASRGGEAGIALPLIPGWTGEARFLERFLSAAAVHGARFVAPFSIAGDGASRAAVHADFARLHPESADAFFDAVHHREWESGARGARETFHEAAAAAGMPARVPFLAGRSDFPANARLIDAFETEAERAEEPRASRLLAAARRLEDLGRDVAGIAREGNLRLLWPSDSPEARAAERVLEGDGRTA